MNAETISHIIWSQISLQTKMSIGARSPFRIERDIIFTVGDSRKRLLIKITLNSKDYYDITLLQAGLGLKHYDLNSAVELKKLEDVDIENLNEILYSLVNK